MSEDHKTIVSLEEIIIKRLDILEEKMDRTREEVAALKVKSGIWGAISGLVGAAMMLLGWLAAK